MSSNPRGKGKSISDNNVNPVMNPVGQYNAHAQPTFAIPTVPTQGPPNPSMMINNGAQLTREPMAQAYYTPNANFYARPPPTGTYQPAYTGYTQQADHSRDYSQQQPYYGHPSAQPQFWQQNTYQRYTQPHQMTGDMSMMPNVPPPTVPNQVSFANEGNSAQHAQLPAAREKKILLIVDPSTQKQIELETSSKQIVTEQPKETPSVEDEEKKKSFVKGFLSQVGSDIAAPQAVPVEPIDSEEVTAEENKHVPPTADEYLESSKEKDDHEDETQKVELNPTSEPGEVTSHSDVRDEVEVVSQPSISNEIIEDEVAGSPAVIPEEEAAPTPEEDVQKKAEEEAERVRLREEELDSLFDSLIKDPEECSRPAMTYNRRFLYCVRDIEKEFHRTTCPLTPKQLEDFGIDLKSMPKSADGKKRTDFNPSWVPQRQSMGGNRPKYTGNRPSDRGGRDRVGGSRNKPYGARPSIDRPVDRKVSLGNKAENAWKPEKLTDDQLVDAENKLKLLLKKVRSLMNKITPTTKDELVKEFLSYQVIVSPENSDLQDTQIRQVIDIIFDKAVEEPKFCPLYSELCKCQVDAELKKDSKVSLFRNCLLTRAQQTFQTKNQEEERAKKVAAIGAETDSTKKRQLQSELDEFDSKFRRRKFGNIIFVGQLFQQQLLSTKIVQWCLFDLINHTHPNKDGVCPEPPYDEESLQCAAQLLNSLGKQLEKAKDFNGVEYLDQTLQHLQAIAPKCSNKIRFLILGVVDLRKNSWVPRKTADQGPKKIDEIHNDIKKEQLETQQQRESYERKAGMRMGGGSMRGPSRNVAPPARNSFDRTSSTKDRRATAASNSKLAGGAAAPKKTISLSQADTSKPLNKTSWRSGAGGGGGSATNEGRSNWSKNGSQDARKSSLAGINQRDLGKRMSSSQQSLASQEADEETEEQRQEKEEKHKKITTRIKSDFEEVITGELKMEEFVQSVFDLQKEEKFGCPKVKEIFARFVRSGLALKSPEHFEMMGRALHLALKNKEHRASIIQGVSLFCKTAVEEGLVEDYPRLWNVVADLIFFATHSTEKVDPDDEGKEVAPPVPVVDFEHAFIEASQPENDYRLLALVLTRIADLVHKQHGDNWVDTCNWTFTDMQFIKKLNQEEFERAMKGAKVPDSNLTLLEIFRHQ